MKNRDLLSSVIWMALGAIFVSGALQQGLMMRDIPGPGFLPFLSGLALMFVSLFVLIPALRKREKGSRSDFFPERDSLKKLLFAVAALFAFGVALVQVGYLLTTFLFILFMMRLMQPRGWRTATLVALMTSGFSYILFVVLLGVQLPRGFLTF